MDVSATLRKKLPKLGVTIEATYLGKRNGLHYWSTQILGVEKLPVQYFRPVYYPMYSLEQVIADISAYYRAYGRKKKPSNGQAQAAS